MRQLAMIADDLTGASDTGVQFARKGLRTTVLFDLQNLPADTAAVEVAVIDTDSRSLPAPQAYHQVAQAARLVSAAGFTHLYKKVDSTLRGNLGTEIDAVMDVCACDLAVVAPAFPRLGRITVGGRHYLGGVPIDQTEIAHDPKCPVTQSDLLTLLGSQSRRKAGLLSLPVLRAGRAATRKAVGQFVAHGIQLVVCDAETAGDLQQIAATLSECRRAILWVGSAGLAEYLPAVPGLAAGRDRAALSVSPSRKPVLLVAGSISSTTREQVTAVQRLPEVTAVELDPLLLLADEQAHSAETERCRSELTAALVCGRDVTLCAGASPDQVAAARAQGARSGLDGAAVANRVAIALGSVAAQVLATHDLAGVILTGGDTARAVCRHLGVSGLQLITEVETGVPLSRLVGSRDLLAVTKAGAFGSEQTLVRALHALKGEQ